MNLREVIFIKACCDNEVRAVSRADRTVICVLLLLCTVALVLVNVSAYGQAVGAVIVEVDGKLYAKYNLSEINSSKIVEINTKYGYNKIEIFSDGVRAVEADCGDMTDVRTGKITRAGEYIVCLPHRLMIRLEGSGHDADALAY